MATLKDLGKSYEKENRHRRRAIYNKLPGKFLCRERVDIAFEIECESRRTMTVLALTKEKRMKAWIKEKNVSYSKYEKAYAALESLIKEDETINQLFFETIKKLNIKDKQINLVLDFFETLNESAKTNKTDIPKVFSRNRNTPTDIGKHDLKIGKLLIDKGMTKHAAAVIIANMRLYKSDEENIKRGVGKIKQRLRNAKL